jgi:hypothetical protein
MRNTQCAEARRTKIDVPFAEESAMKLAEGNLINITFAVRAFWNDLRFRPEFQFAHGVLAPVINGCIGALAFPC